MKDQQLRFHTERIPGTYCLDKEKRKKERRRKEKKRKKGVSKPDGLAFRHTNGILGRLSDDRIVKVTVVGRCRLDFAPAPFEWDLKLFWWKYRHHSLNHLGQCGEPELLEAVLTWR